MPMPLLHLEDALTRLSLMPDLGASLVNWSVKQTGQALLRHSDDDARDAGTPRRLACYPLVPWSNRISEGGFDGPQGWLALEPNTSNDPYPIHGSAWQQPWQVDAHSSQHARLRLKSSQPFAYCAELDITLHEGRLSIKLHVTHLDVKPAWHGLGLHPYLPRTANTQLQAKAQNVWLAEATKLPSLRSAVPPEWDFKQVKHLPNEWVDHAFGGWDGHGLITQADAGYQLSLEASGADHFLLFCPKDADFFCFEPVSHPINAHHLPERPGLRLLHQGQSHELQFNLHYLPFAADDIEQRVGT